MTRTKVFVTVGTTPFDRLVRHIDKHFAADRYDITFQISERAKYIPRNFGSFSYVSNVLRPYQDADMVICHAGAGTVFTLLELKQKIIVCPNTARRDKHQDDLAFWVRRNAFGEACFELPKLEQTVEHLSSISLAEYRREEFFGYQMIIRLCADKTVFSNPQE